MFDIDIPIKSNLYIGLWFTAISFCRGYIIRRFFTKRTEKIQVIINDDLTSMEGFKITLKGTPIKKVTE